MKTATVVALLIAPFIVTLALPAAAYAQGRGLEPRKEVPVNPERKKAEEKAYNDALSRIPKKEFDPWQNVRETPPAQKQSTPPKPTLKKKPDR